MRPDNSSSYQQTQQPQQQLSRTWTIRQRQCFMQHNQEQQQQQQQRRYYYCHQKYVNYMFMTIICHVVTLLLFTTSSSLGVTYAAATATATELNTVGINTDGTSFTTTKTNTTTTTTTTNNRIENTKNNKNMKYMKQYNFYASVRPDVSTFYQSPDTTTISNNIHNNYTEQSMWYKGQGVKFINLSKRNTSLWLYDESNGNGILIDDIYEWGTSGTTTFTNVKFIMTEYRNTQNMYCLWTIQSKISLYYCDPYEDTSYQGQIIHQQSISGQLMLGSELYKQSLLVDELFYYNIHRTNLQFADDYYTITSGSTWLSMYYPESELETSSLSNTPPEQQQQQSKIKLLPMYDANNFGQVHTISSHHTYFTKHITIQYDSNSNLSIEQMKQPLHTVFPHYLPFKSSTTTTTTTTTDNNIKLQLKVVSCAPRVFEIENFLSSYEADYIVSLITNGKYKLQTSGTNGGIHPTLQSRTSSTTWIHRNTDPIINELYKRTADIVQLPESLLRTRTLDEMNVTNTSTTDSISEAIQIVYYNTSQQYKPHYDFGYSKSVTNVQDRLERFLNIGIYLNDNYTGGQTAFPLYRNSHSDQPLLIQPKKGKAILFYMSTSDGNLDILSQHSGLPIVQGEKYFANLWIRTYI